MENGTLDLFNPTKAELQVLATQYIDLTKNKIDNKENFKLVHEAEMKLRSTRVTISKTRKAFTDPKNAEIKQAIELEKELLGIISPIEDSLKERKKEYEDEIERINQEKLEKQRKFLQNRVDQLAYEDYSHHDLFELSQMSEEEFAKLLSEKKEIAKEKAEKAAAEEKAEKERQEKINLRGAVLGASCLENLEITIENIKKSGISLEEFQQDIDQKKQMFEFDKKQEQLKADQEKVAADQKKIENDKIEAQRKKDEDERLEKARKEAAEKATKDAEEAAERKRLEDEAQKKRDDEAKAKKDKEDQEKLEKETKYKDFLEKNGVNQKNIESGEYTISKNEDLKTITIFKKIDVFNF